MDRTIRVGDTIHYMKRTVAATGVVVAIDKCDRRGDKYGKKVDAIGWNERDYAFIKTDSGYCYGSEVV